MKLKCSRFIFPNANITVEPRLFLPQHCIVTEKVGVFVVIEIYFNLTRRYIDLSNFWATVQNRSVLFKPVSEKRGSAEFLIITELYVISCSVLKAEVSKKFMVKIASVTRP